MKIAEKTEAVLGNESVFYDRGWSDCCNQSSRGLRNVNDGIAKLDFTRGLHRLPPFTEKRNVS